MYPLDKCTFAPSDNLGAAWFDQEVEYQVMRGNVDQLMAFRVALQHGPGNPIVVEDDNEDYEPALAQVLVEEDNLDVRVAAGELILFDGAGQGVLIEGEGLPDYEE